MPPPPALLEELLEEIFLRLPPDQPACLVRASLASKLWLGILTGARFRDLYRERHGSPPMLGFIYSGDSGHFREEEEGNLPYFVATTKFGMRIPAVEDWRGWHKDYTAWDCRHGRVLLADTNIFTMPLVVWDPMTRPRTTTAAGPRCSAASTGCDHRACHLGPFQVAFVGLYCSDEGSVAQAHVSLPEVVKWRWSKPCSLDLGTEYAFIVNRPLS
jgi:hypothetical protein